MLSSFLIKDECVNLATMAYRIAKRVAEDRSRRSNVRDTYSFDDRGRGQEVLVILLAGYKPPLWPHVFHRLRNGVPDNADVCVVSAGRFDKSLRELCDGYGWSYLATKTNDVSLVQNVATHLHPRAEQIVKIDEDVFVTPNTIVKMLQYAHDVRTSGIVSPAFIAPMLNVNGVCYRPLLETLGLLEEFEAEFGTARIATLGIPVTDDSAAARWMWERTSPLEETEARLRSTGRMPGLMSPVQFSIGIIVVERAFWSEIGFYPVKRHALAMGESTLGADEEYLCRMAIHFGRPMMICEKAIAGHFSFGRQYQGMLELLKERPELF